LTLEELRGRGERPGIENKRLKIQPCTPQTEAAPEAGRRRTVRCWNDRLGTPVRQKSIFGRRLM